MSSNKSNRFEKNEFKRIQIYSLVRSFKRVLATRAHSLDCKLKARALKNLVHNNAKGSAICGISIWQEVGFVINEIIVLKYFDPDSIVSEIKNQKLIEDHNGLQAYGAALKLDVLKTGSIINKKSNRKFLTKRVVENYF